MDRRTTPLTVHLVDVERFRAEAAAWMAADPIGTNVMATVSGGADADAIPDAAWILVRAGDEVVAAAIRTPPWPLNLPAMTDDALEAVASALHARGDVLTALSGDVRSTATFARRWTELTGAHAVLAVAQGVYVLGGLVPPSGVPGAARVATLEDAAVVGPWLAAFDAEVHVGPARPPAPEALACRLDAGLLVLWEVGGRPVSVAGWHHPSAGVARVGPVFTPVDQRGRGYAAAVTAAATRAALAATAEHVMLFTDLANPTSNRVYTRLGYRQMGEASEWSLTPPHHPS